MKNVSIKKVREQLDLGIDRDEITKELGLNPREAKLLWQHPDLKGVKKAKYKVELNFVEDEPVVETLNAPVQQKSIDFEL